MYFGTNYIKPYLKRDVQIQQIKANLRYITHRPTLEGERGARQLFGWDGDTNKHQGYQIIDTASKGTRFWRFKISPDPKTENPEKKIDLRKLTMRVMVELRERKGNVEFLAVIHNDHSGIPHVHAIVIFKERLGVKDLKALRDVARESALSQQKNRILVQEYLKYLRFRQNYQPSQRFVDRPIGMAGGRALQTHEPFIRVSVPKYSCQECGMKQFKKFARCPNCGAQRERYAGLSL
ncbi:MAG: hypothetical protein M3264_10330 [Thermoproteota archaeon]|nr:hypothetical protein [Thermoproteota archaeon]